MVFSNVFFNADHVVKSIIKQSNSKQKLNEECKISRNNINNDNDNYFYVEQNKYIRCSLQFFLF